MNYTRPRLAITLQPIMQAFAELNEEGLNHKQYISN